VTRNTDNRRLGRLRQGQGEIANHIIDEFAADRLSRRDFIRRATVVGISAPLLGSILAACSSSSLTEIFGGGSSTRSSSTSASASAGAAGMVIRAGIVTPTGAINPLTVADQGGLDMLAQTGEYLCLATQDLTLQPVLASSWSANSAADIWTFKIRQGVKFHNGRPLTADDVMYTYQLHTDPKNSSEALAAFAGVLSPSGVVRVDDYTVAFQLEAPNGNFPYLTSSDNYNVIILPNGYDPANWQRSFIGTGPFVLSSYTPNVGATFNRNESYWGAIALPSQTQFTFYETQGPAILALTDEKIDVLGQFTVTGGEQLLAGGYNVIVLQSSAHRELSMRCDQAPFTDPRVRQAIALTLNRSQIITALFGDYANIGNDSPFAPVFPSTNTGVAQRTQDLSQAKSLLSAAGYPNGFSTQLVTEDFLEIPDYAQIVAASAKQVGVNIHLKVESSTAYYGQATFGKSDWLDATMSLVDYGHRSVPNLFLTAPLQTINATTGTGAWNAAHFNNSQYNRLIAQYIGAVEVSTQKTIAGQIETLLLDQTPVIYAYFYNYLAATAQDVTGVYPTAIGHLFLYNAAMT
jgi:peptide/nickel transport system substrate-binding protein